MAPQGFKCFNLLRLRNRIANVFFERNALQRIAT